MPKIAARNASTRPFWPPIRASMSVSCWLASSPSGHAVRRAAQDAPVTASATIQPMSRPRCSRQASANGLRRAGAAGRGAGRCRQQSGADVPAGDQDVRRGR